MPALLDAEARLMAGSEEAAAEGQRRGQRSTSAPATAVGRLGLRLHLVRADRAAPVYGSQLRRGRGPSSTGCKVNNEQGIPVPDRSIPSRSTSSTGCRHAHEEPAHDYTGTRRWSGSTSSRCSGKKRLDRLSGARPHFMAASAASASAAPTDATPAAPRSEPCCSAGRCCGRRPAPRQVQYVHAVLRNALGPPSARSW